MQPGFFTILLQQTTPIGQKKAKVANSSPSSYLFRMKLSQFILWGMLISALGGFAHEIKIGDSKETVLNLLGEPSGFMEINETLVLLFDRGEVVLKNDSVFDFELISQEEADRNKEEVAKRLALLEKEGVALKKEKLADPNFISAPTAYQLAYWKDFRTQYPMVPVNDLIDSLEIKNQKEFALLENQTEQDQRIAELEYRLSIAEERAKNARRNSIRYTPYFNYPSYFNYTRRYSVYKRHKHHDVDHPKPRVRPKPPRRSNPTDVVRIPKPPRKNHRATDSSHINPPPRHTNPRPPAPPKNTHNPSSRINPPLPSQNLTTGEKAYGEDEMRRINALERAGS